MIFPSRIKTVKWDRTGKDIVDESPHNQDLLKRRCLYFRKKGNRDLLSVFRADSVAQECLKNELTPLDWDELREETYNVMA